MKIRDYMKRGIVKTGIVEKLAQLKTNERFIILRYHSISPDNYKNETMRCPSISVTPELFEQQVAYLTKHYQVISLNEAVSSVQNNEPFRDRGVVITFDDGYEDNFIYAYPILKRHNATATFYITTGSIDKDIPFWVSYLRQLIYNAELPCGQMNFLNLPKSFFKINDSGEKKSFLADFVTFMMKKCYGKERDAILNSIKQLCGNRDYSECIMSKEQIRQLSDDGMTIGSHTVTHPILPILNSNDVLEELLISKMFLEDIIGKSVNHLAYPNGCGIANYNGSVIEMVKKAGYLSASTSERGFLYYSSDSFSIKRQGINQGLGFEGFVWKLQEDKIYFHKKKKFI